MSAELYRCPCRGDDTMGTRPICGGCREAGCEETADATGERGYFNCQRERGEP